MQNTCDNRAGPGRRNPFATTENLVASNLPKMFHAEKMFHGIVPRRKKCSTKMFHAARIVPHHAKNLSIK
jgi:hypothetical protein